MHEAKSVNTQPMKNFEGCFFEHWSIDEKSDVKVEKHLRVAELKLKVLEKRFWTFSISALQLEVTFQLSLAHLTVHLWTLCQKSVP